MATKFTYTDTDVTEIVAKYQSGVSLDVLAVEYNKSVPSVRMKLVKLGVYQKVGTTAKPKTSATTVVVEKTSFPTTKSGILAYYKTCVAKVGYSDF